MCRCQKLLWQEEGDASMENGQEEPEDTKLRSRGGTRHGLHRVGSVVLCRKGYADIHRNVYLLTRSFILESTYSRNRFWCLLM